MTCDPSTLRQDTDDPIELYRRAAAAQGALAALLADITERFDCHLDVPAAPKGLDRATEKAAREYGGDFARMLDLARASVIAHRRDDIPAITAALRQRIEVVKLKDRFAQPQPSGYRDIMANVRFRVPGADGRPASLIGEMQVHWEPLHRAKHGYGNLLYKGVRTITGALTAEQRSPTPPEQRLLTALRAAERGWYARASAAALGPVDAVLAALQERAAVAAAEAAGNGFAMVPAFYADIVTHMAGDLLVLPAAAGKRVHKTALGRARDLMALRAAYGQCAASPDLADARSQVERSVGITAGTRETRRRLADFCLSAALYRLAPEDQARLGGRPADLPDHAACRAAVLADPAARRVLCNPAALALHRDAVELLGFAYPQGHAVLFGPGGAITVRADGGYGARDNPDGPATRIPGGPGAPPRDLYYANGVRVPHPVNRPDLAPPDPAETGGLAVAAPAGRR